MRSQYLTALSAAVCLLITVPFIRDAAADPFSPPAGKMKGKKISSFIEQTTTIPLKFDSPVYSLALTADADFQGTDSLVRAVLVDENSQEYLVYEAYPLINGVDKGPFRISRGCDETCVLDGVMPSHLRIQVEKASVGLKKISFAYSPDVFNSDVPRKDLKGFSQKLKHAQDKAKIEKINGSILKKSLPWTAGETTVSGMSYARKRGLFGKELPNLQGFEYYTGGYFTLVGSGEAEIEGAPKVKTTPTPAATIAPPAVPADDLISYPNPGTATLPPPAWDWRNAHGENWMTPVRNQGWCGSCWDFAAVATVETDINLYFNQHLNIDLSEQDILSCSNSGSCSGGWSSSALAYFGTSKVVNESCMPYRTVDANGCNYDTCTFTPVLCSSKCPAPTQQVKTSGSAGVSSTEPEIKMAVVKNGAVSGSVSAWSHAMSIVGYGVIKAGDRIFSAVVDGSNSSRIIPEGDPLIGKTYWIFKNSWGSGWGESGYLKLVYATGGTPGVTKVITPISVESATPPTIACNDRDGDGFCNWGISASRPETCPAACAAEPDCDDSSSSTGACVFPQVRQEYVSVCREYLPSATYCPSTGQTCPTGYTAYSTNSICATGKGKSKQYWTHCARNFNACGTCPAGTVLASYQNCSAGMICSSAVNQCAYSSTAGY